MTTQKPQKPTTTRSGGGTDTVYGMGVIGAWIYYFQRATTTEQRIKAFFKGLVWPAFMVYDLSVFLEKKKAVQE